MTIILEQSTIPETGTFEIHKTVNIQISAKQAQRKVDTWLLNEVSYMMGAEEPTLLIGERTVWRAPCRFTAPHVGRVGKVGDVDVDAETGEMYHIRKTKAAILCCANMSQYSYVLLPVAHAQQRGESDCLVTVLIWCSSI